MLVARFCNVHHTFANLPAVSNSYARTHNQRRRIEKMLRRRALFLAGAKAQK